MRRCRLRAAAVGLLLAMMIPVLGCGVGSGRNLTAISHTAAQTIAYAADGKGLTHVESTIYEQLKAQIQDVANGKRTDTKFICQTSFSGADFAAADANLIITYLLNDCPFDLFWHDKTRTVENGESKDGVYCQYDQNGMIEFDFKVSAPYRQSAGDLFSVNPSAIAKSVGAKQAAQQIITANSQKSDYEKLVAYRDVICNLVTYDYGALATNAYGDAHQLIHVFDQDTNTNVVCEGYAKAFKYLCDLTAFEHPITCYLISGVSDAGNGAGDHMWNLVRIGSESYLVDVTNCDSGTIGADYELFLKDNTTGSVDSGFTFYCYGQDPITYYYDQSTKTAFGPTILSLINGSHSALDSLRPVVPTPAPTPKPETTNEKKPEKKEDTPIVVDFKFREAAIRKSYGDEPFVAEYSGVPEGMTIEYKSSDPSIAKIVDGKVQVLKPGTVAITAMVGETTASYTLTVDKRRLSWDVEGLHATDPGTGWDADLNGELGIAGILESDMDDASVFRFSSEDLTGIYQGQKIVLNWKEGKQWRLTGSKAAYYELPDLLPELEGRIVPAQVLDTPPESTDERPLNLEMEDLVTVPEGLLEEPKFDTTAKIESYMRDALPADAIMVCDVSLSYQDDKGDWVPAVGEQFPAEGVTVTLPYPEGTSPETFTFTVCHMLGDTYDGQAPGTLEYPDVQTTEEGISFKVHSLSPIALGWTPIHTTRAAVATDISAPPVMNLQSIFLSLGAGFGLLLVSGGLLIKMRKG